MIKSLRHLVLISAILTPGTIFAIDEELQLSQELSGPTQVKSSSCCTWSYFKSNTREALKTGFEITGDAITIAAPNVMVDLLSQKYGRIPTHIAEALLYALEHYKAQDDKTQAFVNMASAVGTAASQENNVKDVLSSSAIALLQEASTLTSSQKPATWESFSIHLALTLSKDLEDDGHVNASNKDAYLISFTQMTDLLEPDETATDTLSVAKRASLDLATRTFKKLLNGKPGNRAQWVEDIQEALRPFHHVNASSPKEIQQEKVFSTAQLILNIASAQPSLISQEVLSALSLASKDSALDAELPHS